MLNVLTYISHSMVDPDLRGDSVIRCVADLYVRQMKAENRSESYGCQL